MPPITGTRLALALLLPQAAFSSSAWITPDFFIETTGFRSEASMLAPRDSCRERIQRLMCLVDPGPPGAPMGEPRPCLPGGDAYAQHFEALHDLYPPPLQRMFCSLKVVYIEKEFFGTAYAGMIVDPAGKPQGAKLGIRKSTLDSGLSLRAWASWKEQLSFGGNPASYDLVAGLPEIKSSSPAGINDFLYFVIAHEFGHLFDFANQLNRHASPECSKQQEEAPWTPCQMHPQSWGALSWDTDRKPKPENDFAHREGLCFYWCNGSPLDRSVIPSLYWDLDHTSFLSIYATTQPWDDFADSLAYYLMNEHLRTAYLIDPAQGRPYNVMSKIHTRRFAPKLAYLREFLKSESILYP